MNNTDPRGINTIVPKAPRWTHANDEYIELIMYSSADNLYTPSHTPRSEHHLLALNLSLSPRIPTIQDFKTPLHDIQRGGGDPILGLELVHAAVAFDVHEGALPQRHQVVPRPTLGQERRDLPPTRLPVVFGPVVRRQRVPEHVLPPARRDDFRGVGETADDDHAGEAGGGGGRERAAGGLEAEEGGGGGGGPEGGQE